MSPDTPLFGRMTLGNNRINLGRAGFSILMIRATEQLRKSRIGDSTVIQLEMSRDKLPDSTTFDRASLQEQQFIQNLEVNPNDESPYEGITLGRVSEVMMSQAYENYAFICEPVNRIGIPQGDIFTIQEAYKVFAPDCLPHFPKWIP